MTELPSHSFALEQAPEGISHQIVQFSHFVRAKGMKVGVQETSHAVEIAQLGLIKTPNTFKNALSAVFCHCREDKVLFHQLFEEFWLKQDDGKRKGQMKMHVERITKSANQRTSIMMMGRQKNDSQSNELKDSQTTSGASLTNRLRRTDLSKMTEVDEELLEELAEKLWKQMNLRLSRRRKNAHKPELLNLRQTIRQNVGNGGEMIYLSFKKKKKRKPRLLVLLDVSGSMDKYSLFLLRFIYALRENFAQLEAFLFSTQMVHITDLVKQKITPKDLKALSIRANAWASGTKIGNCFKDFNENYAPRTLNNNTLVLILSDGLDTGAPEVLNAELKKIARKARKLIWLNPLKGMQGYEPTARGMQAAMPHVDVFQSAHSLDSLLALEQYLQDV